MVGAVGCGSGDVVVWIVTDLFIASVVVVGAVAGFGAVVHASFLSLLMERKECGNGMWEQ